MRHCSVIQALLGLVFLAGLEKAAGEEDSVVVLPALENGDVNGDWVLDVSDSICLLNHLYSGGPAPVPVFCDAASSEGRNGDVNGDGALDLSDAVRFLMFLFGGGPDLASACGIGLGSGAGAALGPNRAEMTPFTARLVFDVPDPPAPEARLWIDGGGNLHLRNGRRAADVSGDLEGRFFGVANLNVDAATFAGTGFGTFDMEVTWQGRTGTWSGSYSATIDGPSFFSRFVAQGSGGLAGTRIFGTTVDDGDDLLVNGQVLSTGD
jgi:hypothetical protein